LFTGGNAQHVKCAQHKYGGAVTLLTGCCKIFAVVPQLATLEVPGHRRMAVSSLSQELL